MQPTSVHLPFTDANGRQQSLTAVTVDGCGWALQVVLDGHPWTGRCRNWQQVERTVRCLMIGVPERVEDGHRTATTA